MQDLTLDEIELVSGGVTATGAALALVGTGIGIAGGVAIGGFIGVLAIAGAAVVGLGYAYDAAAEMASKSS